MLLPSESEVATGQWANAKLSGGEGTRAYVAEGPRPRACLLQVRSAKAYLS